MEIVYRKGDLLEAPEIVLAHGCNAQGVMGSGVAKAIRARYPSAYAAYRAQYENHNLGLNLGDVIWVSQSDGKTIANCITQERYGKDGRRYVDYDAVRLCMREINAVGFALQQQKRNWWDEVDSFFRFAMPKIGAGLGGGNWDEIAKIVEEETIWVQAVVYEL